MEAKNLIYETKQYLEKFNFYTDRLNEDLYLIEKEIQRLLGNIRDSAFEDCLIFFKELEEFKLIVAKIFYNGYKIEIPDRLLRFVYNFERTDIERERENLWKKFLQIITFSNF